MSEQTTVSQRPAHKSPDESWPEYVERAVADERERCAGIVRDCLRWRGVERPWPADLEHIIEKICSGESA